MKFKILIVLTFIALVAIACGVKKSPQSYQTKNDGMFAPVAVIELFTSQGCSSCPPADALLAQTIASAKKDNKNIFALSFHVDYWNRLGWADPFSNAAYSARQSNYVTAFKLDGAYTPQMIVNGKDQFTGSDNDALSKSLSNALSINAGINFKTLTATCKDDKTIHLQYALEGELTGSAINFALVSLKETTIVKRGENGGHTLTNENIVRQLITTKAAASGEINFAASPVPEKENIAMVAFVQQEKSLKIIGAAMAKIN
ncbi:DUF1223 domain-containing protein [Ferruginibacter sp. SUN106]|uniref:DUF1223 domain-containing protein n=1 Tax=Ferruginibacter sp. SUN106 TaxID=2978348 RepID=UPI003D360168